MAADDPRQVLAEFLRPWHEAAACPAKAQEHVLQQLLDIHASTSYGKQHSANQIESIADFRRAIRSPTTRPTDP